MHLYQQGPDSLEKWSLKDDGFNTSRGLRDVNASENHA